MLAQGGGGGSFFSGSGLLSYRVFFSRLLFRSPLPSLPSFSPFSSFSSFFSPLSSFVDLTSSSKSPSLDSPMSEITEAASEGASLTESEDIPLSPTLLKPSSSLFRIILAPNRLNLPTILPFEASSLSPLGFSPPVTVLRFAASQRNECQAKPLEVNDLSGRMRLGPVSLLLSLPFTSVFLLTNVSWVNLRHLNDGNRFDVLSFSPLLPLPTSFPLSPGCKGEVVDSFLRAKAVLSKDLDLRFSLEENSSSLGLSNETLFSVFFYIIS